MSYATADDYASRYTQREATALSSQGRSIDDALATASAFVDTYLATRYVVPLSSTPPDVVSATLSIARYELYADAATDRIGEAYSSAIAYLKDVAAGRAIIAGAMLAAADGSAQAGQSPARSGQAKSSFNWNAY